MRVGAQRIGLDDVEEVSVVVVKPPHSNQAAVLLHCAVELRHGNELGLFCDATRPRLPPSNAMVAPHEVRGAHTCPKQRVGVLLRHAPHRLPLSLR
eukprot:scaffold1355_cov268-Pinguiococcus_pyrenoidosus.AAC.79